MSSQPLSKRSANLAHLRDSLGEALEASMALRNDGGRRLEFSMFDLAVSSWRERVTEILQAELSAEGQS
jgi:hypothetical protein